MKKYITTFLAIVLLSGCYKESNFSKPEFDPISQLEIEALNTSILADSISVARLVFTLPKEVDDSKSTILLSSDSGIFLESGTNTLSLSVNDRPGYSQKIGQASLRSTNKIGTATIKITFESAVKYLYVNFTRAFPESILLTSSSLEVKPKNNSEGEITFTSTLKRVIGVPSVHQVVDLIVTDTFFHQIGQFKSYTNLSDNNNNCTYTYVLGDSVMNNGVIYLGKLYAIARTKKEDNTFIMDTINIFSTK